MGQTPYSRLLAALGDAETFLDQWSGAFAQSPMRMPRPLPSREIAPLVSAMIEGLAYSLAPANHPADTDGTDPPPHDDVLRPGTPSMRELEQAVAFAGASLAGRGVSGFDTAACILAVRDVARGYLDPPEQTQISNTFEWLTVVALDAYGTAKEMGGRERIREQLERDTPVVLVAPMLPAMLLVGEPDTTGFHAIVARLIMLIARVGANAAIIDATGLENPDGPAAVEALGRLFAHRKIAGKVHFFATGLTEEEEQRWAELARSGGTSLTCELQFIAAVNRALEHAGYAVKSIS